MGTSNKHCHRQAGKHSLGSQCERAQSCKWKAGNGAASRNPLPYPRKGKGTYCCTAALFSWILTDSKNGNVQHLWVTCTTTLFSWWKRLFFCHSEPLRFQFKTVLVLPLCTPLNSQASLIWFLGELLLDSITSASSPVPTRAASPLKAGAPALDHVSHPHFIPSCAGSLSQVPTFSSTWCSPHLLPESES